VQLSRNLLISDYTEFVVRQIAALKLYVRVVWVGPHVQTLMEQLADDFNVTFRAAVALDWHPGALTARNTKKYTSVSFPACEPDDPFPDWPCSRLTLHRFVKVAWRPLKDTARIAFEVRKN
jgi:hypothetical protein